MGRTCCSMRDVGLEELLSRFGLLAVFLLAAIEGDISVILAGVVAHLGFFSLFAAIAVGTIGACAGDCAWFFIARSHAATIREGRIYRRIGPTVEALAGRLGVWSIIAARFVYGTRIATIVFWGVQRLSFVKFALCDLAGCALWASLFATLGYLLSGSAAALIGEIKRVEVWLLVGFIAVAAMLLLVRLLLWRRHRRFAPRS
jgi:membrane protein DedA with SNARE-associated domain